MVTMSQVRLYFWFQGEIWLLCLRKGFTSDFKVRYGYYDRQVCTYYVECFSVLTPLVKAADLVV